MSLSMQAGNAAGNFDACLLAVRSTGEPQLKSRQWIFDNAADTAWPFMTVCDSGCVCNMHACGPVSSTAADATSAYITVYDLCSCLQDACIRALLD